MSIRLMAAALETSLPPTAKLVLVGLCDFANDDGDSVWPSLDTIARRASVSRSTGQRTLRGLEDLGLIEKVRGAGGRGITNAYRVNVVNLTSFPPVVGETETRSNEALKQVTQDEKAGRSSDLRTTIEPSVEPPTLPNGKVAPSGAIELKTRRRDPIFELLFALDTGLAYSKANRATLTRSALGVLQRSASEVAAVGIEPEELATAVRYWPELFPGAVCTSAAVMKHLPRLRAAARGMIARRHPRDDGADLVAGAMELLKARPL